MRGCFYGSLKQIKDGDQEDRVFWMISYSGGFAEVVYVYLGAAGPYFSIWGEVFLLVIRRELWAAPPGLD